MPSRYSDRYAPSCPVTPVISATRRFLSCACIFSLPTRGGQGGLVPDWLFQPSVWRHLPTRRGSSALVLHRCLGISNHWFIQATNAALASMEFRTAILLRVSRKLWKTVCFVAWKVTNSDFGYWRRRLSDTRWHRYPRLHPRLRSRPRP